MYKFLNMHPKGLMVGDCVKRALSFATDTDYTEISKQLNRLKREVGGTKFNDNKVWREYIQRKGWKKLSFPAEKGIERMNGEKFCKKFKNGTYILRMAKHLTVCKNGVIYDTWDCSNKCVYNAWIVE